jgi:hypothetical protein
MHEIVIDGERRAIDDVLEIGRVGARPALRVHRLDDGDACVVTAGAATRDGVDIVGNLCTVAWGDGAVVRCADGGGDGRGRGRLRVDVVWRTDAARAVAGAGGSCRLCFGSFADEEVAMSCACESALFHAECEAVRISCPTCGRSSTGSVA